MVAARGRMTRRAAAAVLVAVLAAGASGCAWIVRASVSGTGAQGSGPSEQVALDGAGRAAAFRSAAPDLVARDTNGVADVFVRDHETGETVRVSVAGDGSEADGASHSPSISDDGRRVAFVSSAADLVPGDANGRADVFVRDLDAGTTVRLPDVSNAGFTFTGGRDPALSGDGRHVVYVKTLTVAALDALVSYDLDTATSTVIATTPITPPIALTFSSPSITDDGAFVTYLATGTHSIGVVVSYELVLWTRAGATKSTIASTGLFEPPTGAGLLSGDGRFVAFGSGEDVTPEADPCVIDPDPAIPPVGCESDVFVWDRVAGTFERTSLAPDGSEPAGHSTPRGVSDDGRFVLWSSEASPALGATTTQLYVRDRLEGRTARVSEIVAGVAPAAATLDGAISGDGAVVAFDSGAADLVSGDTNGTTDVFARRTLVPAPGSVTPSVAAGSGPVAVSVAGHGFSSSSVVSVAVGGIDVSGVAFGGPALLTATVTVDAGVPPGAYDVWVTEPPRFGVANLFAIGRCAGCLTVTAPS